MTIDEEPLPFIANEQFGARSSAAGGKLLVSMTGVADMSEKEALDSFFDALHRHAIARACKHVEIDLRNMEFMNSSCLKAFVTWALRNKGQAAEGQYQISFLANEAFYWQRRSLNAIACISKELIAVRMA